MDNIIYVTGDREEEFRLQLPEGWVLEVNALGWDAWAHSPDGEIGVAEQGESKSAAIRKLKKRLEEWQALQLTQIFNAGEGW